MTVTDTQAMIQRIMDQLYEDEAILPEETGDTRKRLFDSGKEILTTTDKVIKSYIRITRDDRSIERVPAYRIQHNNIAGFYKGGIRYNEVVNEQEVENLAVLMTLKNALHELPYGGGKGGVVISPDQYSDRELYMIAKKYVQRFVPDIGPTHDIPAPDMGTNDQTMDWMVGEYKTIKPGENYLGAFTGKSVENGGARGRRESTGKGTYRSYLWLLDTWTRRTNRDSVKEGVHQLQYDTLKSLLDKSDNGSPITMAVQGFGNVGSVAAEMADKCDRLNHRVVAVSDQYVTLYHEDGLDVQALARYQEKRRHLPVTEAELQEANIKATIQDRNDLVYLDVDVLVLAAIEDVVNENNISQIKAKVFVEGANAPIDTIADTKLHDEGRVVIPDVLANAGGVMVSYVEWKQDRVTELFTEEEVIREMYNKMEASCEKVFESYFKEGLSGIRNTCYVHALKRLFLLHYRHGKLY